MGHLAQAGEIADRYGLIGKRRRASKEEAVIERVILGTMLILHGLIHTLGVAAFWRPTDLAPVRSPCGSSSTHRLA